MAKPTTVKRASPFAHLLTLGRSAKGVADDNQKSDDEEMSDDDEGATAAKAKSKAKADDDDDGDGDKTKEESPNDGKDGKKAKSKAKAEDDETDEDDVKEKAIGSGRSVQAAHMRAVLGAKSAASHPALAAHLASMTNLATADAVEILDLATAQAPAPARVAVASLGDRMAEVKTPKLGADGSGGAITLGGQIIAAGKKAGIL